MILYTLDIDNRKHALKTSLIYLVITLFCVAFGAIYEGFSHEVYSFYMIYAFVFPLAGGVLPFCIMASRNIKKYPDMVTRNLYHSGIATFTVGSIVQGILDIYGTTNTLTGIYWIVGAVFVFSSLTGYVFMLFRNK